MAFSWKMWTLIVICVCLSCTSVYSIKPFVLEEQILWESSAGEDVSMYRIPIIVQTPVGDLLAFSEARKYSGADAGAKFIAMRRSTNRGDSWGSNEYILNDFLVPDGLNLGTVTIDYNTGTLILLYTFCVHSVCNGTGGGEKPSGVYMATSSNWGYSWSEPVNLAKTNIDLKDLHWDPGPGYGIQKKYHPHKGRLVTCGHTPISTNRTLYCLFSDDGGVTWKLSSGLMGMPYEQDKRTGDFVPGEVQIVELKNGTILANIRNTYAFHCHCRIQALSFDGGETFPAANIRLKEELIDPNVCGSLLNFEYQDIIFFTNAMNTSSRSNLTLHWSLDSGASYPNLLNIYQKESAYSCLTNIDANHIGLVYEKDNYKFVNFVKVQLNL